MATPPIKILLIIDRDATAERLAGVLREIEEKRYSPERIGSMEEARAALREGDAAACFLACETRGGWGMDLLRETKARNYRTPIIAIGDEKDDTWREEAFRDGAVDYLDMDEITPPLLDRVIRYCFERERIQTALLTSEAEARQLALVAKRTDNAVIITDAEGLVTWVNEGFTRITGYTFDEALGRKPGHLLQGPDTDPATVDFMRRHLERGEGFKTEIVNYTKAGEPYWLAIEVQPVRTEAGEIANFMAIESDITEQKRTEEALRDREERLRAVVNNLVDGIITIDRKGIVESFSPAAERIFGYSSGEVVGENVRLLMPEPFRSEHDRYVERYLRTGEARIIGVGREVTGRRKDGTVFLMDLAVSEVTVEDHNVFVGIVRDITQRKQMEELKDEFLRVASHDMKNPLGSILGYADLVREFIPPGEEMTEESYGFLERILKNARVMQKIIVDFLDFHALEDGKLKLEKEPCDLNEIAGDLVESTGEIAKKKRIEVRADLDGDLPAVEADVSRVRQVVQNFVDNAVKFSPEGSSVVVRTRRAEGWARFEVRDSGPGLTEEDFQRVFQKYARLSTKPTGGEKSSGLGLAIARQLVEVHGGEIGVYNGGDGGAVFWFQLPLDAGDAPS